MHLVMYQLVESLQPGRIESPRRGRVESLQRGRIESLQAGRVRDLQPAHPTEPRRSLTDAALGFESLDFARPGVTRLGALIPPGPHAGDVVDLNRALAVKLAADDVGVPEAEADSLLPSDIMGFLHHGEVARAIAREAFQWVLEGLERFDQPDLLRGSVVVPRRSIRLCAPVPHPGKIVAVTRNYPANASAHTAQCESEPVQEPVLFIKSSSAVIGPGDDIVIPAAAHEVDYEGELAVVIGATARRVTPEQALEHVCGYTVANDVTARDYQNARGQHFLGKSCDTFAPLGPVLVTREEIDDPQKLRIETRVSGERRQSASTGEMIFGVAEIIAFASQLMTLDPGDVILTGTPAGVGASLHPPRFLREGDVVDIEIEGVGRLRNHVSLEPRD
jgi:2-keto-4-pentenoate hydratase/2-oxohepta-3-ene-1,7-dioic acid hydratase in catechol pathway